MEMIVFLVMFNTLTRMANYTCPSELQDFQMYWRQSMLDDDGKPRPSGGTKTTVEGVSGVDYEKFLIPWSKGNSPSFDMTTMRRSIFLLGLLVERLRLMLRAQDLGSNIIHAFRWPDC